MHIYRLQRSCKGVGGAMETSSDANPDIDANSSSTGRGIGNSRRYALQFPALNLLLAPAWNLLGYSGIFPPRSDQPEREGAVAASDSGRLVRGSGELSIRIIDGAGQDDVSFDESDEAIERIIFGVVGQRSGHDGVDGGNGSEVRDRERDSLASSASADGAGNEDGSDRTVGGGDGGRDSLYRRYDLQRFAGWVEQVVPFSLLLLVVFIRRHLQGFFIIIWIAAVMFKSNDIVRKQTALKDERKMFALVGISTAFMLHTIGVYQWYQNDDLFYPLLMVPPKAVPPFWHAIFVILVNDTMVRQAAMALKCVLLMCYKIGRGHNFRQQGQMLTLVEYTLLLYRALLPAPVWYRFFLNKDYGSLFSSLTTGLYLTFKLTSIIEKVQSVLDAMKALSRKEVLYGFYATLEQVNAAGELCVICQEKMHVPILLHCKHVFCEGCVSEWFEREKACPLCRALVRPGDVHSFGDGSTSLFFQFF